MNEPLSTPRQRKKQPESLPLLPPEEPKIRHHYQLQQDVSFKILLILLVTSCLIRLFRISNPPQVVFDEVHFGGFASKYIKGTFFLDVHRKK